MIAVFIVFMLIASTFTIGKAALAFVTPTFFIGFRMVVAGSLLLAYLAIFKPHTLRIHRADLRYFALIAFFQTFVSYVCEFWALQYVSSIKACLLFNLSPFFTALLAWAILGERLSRKQIIALFVGFGGMIPVLLEESQAELAVGSLFSLSFAEIALLCSVAAFSYGWIVMKQLVHKGYSSMAVNGISYGVGGVLALITAGLTTPVFIRTPASMSLVMIPGIGELTPWWSAVIFFLFFTMGLIIIANIGAYNLYGWLLKHYSATFLSLAGLTTPLFAAIFGYLFLGESVTTNFFISLGMVISAVYLFYQDELLK
jgi:drug/metabolite transporter (DMT)-like permease